MRTLKRSLVLLWLFLTAPTLLAQSKSDPFPLTVDSVMRAPELVGYAPDSLRWSVDSQKLYFDWRKPGEDEATLHDEAWIREAGAGFGSSGVQFVPDHERVWSDRAMSPVQCDAVGPA